MDSIWRFAQRVGTVFVNIPLTAFRAVQLLHRYVTRRIQGDGFIEKQITGKDLRTNRRVLWNNAVLGQAVIEALAKVPEYTTEVHSPSRWEYSAAAVWNFTLRLDAFDARFWNVMSHESERLRSPAQILSIKLVNRSVWKGFLSALRAQFSLMRMFRGYIRFVDTTGKRSLLLTNEEMMIILDDMPSLPPTLDIAEISSFLLDKLEISNHSTIRLGTLCEDNFDISHDLLSSLARFLRSNLARVRSMTHPPVSLLVEMGPVVMRSITLDLVAMRTEIVNSTGLQVDRVQDVFTSILRPSTFDNVILQSVTELIPSRLTHVVCSHVCLQGWMWSDEVYLAVPAFINDRGLKRATRFFRLSPPWTNTDNDNVRQITLVVERVPTAALHTGQDDYDFVSGLRHALTFFPAVRQVLVKIVLQAAKVNDCPQAFVFVRRIHESFGGVCRPFVLPSDVHVRFEFTGTFHTMEKFTQNSQLHPLPPEFAYSTSDLANLMRNGEGPVNISYHNFSMENVHLVANLTVTYGSTTWIAQSTGPW